MMVKCYWPIAEISGVNNTELERTENRLKSKVSF